MISLCKKAGDNFHCCRSVTGADSCLRNDYYSSTGAMQHGSSGLQHQVIAIQSWINFERTARGVLESVGRGLRDNLRPLLDRATRVADRSRNCGSIAIVIGQNVSLSHGAEGTAC
jgi:hypothetical protein